MEEPRYDADGNSLYGHDGRYIDRLGDHIQPRKGFIYPDDGDEIVALQDHKTPAYLSNPRTGIIKTGDVGKVIDCRKPGTFDQVKGYMGLVVHFQSISGSYPCGVVLPWDAASDPKTFSFRKRVTESTPTAP